MQTIRFPVIDLAETGQNIERLRKKRGLSVRDLQSYFGFEQPQAIYKWQRGQSLPTVDNLYALGVLLDVAMDEILVSAKPEVNKNFAEQQASACCSDHFCRLFWMQQNFGCGLTIFPSPAFAKQWLCKDRFWICVQRTQKHVIHLVFSRNTY